MENKSTGERCMPFVQLDLSGIFKGWDQSMVKIYGGWDQRLPANSLMKDASHLFYVWMKRNQGKDL